MHVLPNCLIGATQMRMATNSLGMVPISTPHHLQRCFRQPLALGLDLRHLGVDFREVGSGQLEIDRAQVLVDAMQFGGARNRHDPGL